MESHANTSESQKSRTGSCSTPETTSPDSTGDRSRHREFEARDFLERYSLPRVVRVAGGEPLLLYRCFDSFTKVQARGVVGKKGKEKADANVLHFPEGYSGKCVTCLRCCKFFLQEMPPYGFFFTMMLISSKFDFYKNSNRAVKFYCSA